MKIVTGRQMRDADKMVIDNFGISGISLMENAALSMVSIIEEVVIEKVAENYGNDYNNVNILIIAGKGNNGGDGFALGRILHNNGYNVNIISLENIKSITGDALINYERADNIGLITQFYTLSVLEKYLTNATIVIDGILGTGNRGEIREPYKSVIEYINKYSKYIMSIDIPSGVNADTGEVVTIAIKANKTISFVYTKLGLLTREGSEYSGMIHTTDIGFPSKALESIKTRYHYINKKEAGEILPKRKIRSNKGTFGKISIIAGNESMVGAAFLASKSAYKIGGGIVYVYTSSKGIAPLQTLIPEAIINRMEEEYIKENFEKIIKSSAIIIGPGLGVNSYNKKLLIDILENAINPIVIDADGINNLVEIKYYLKNAKTFPVLTPHPGEMSGLTGKTVDEILKNPVEIALILPKNIIVLFY